MGYHVGNRVKHHNTMLRSGVRRSPWSNTFFRPVTLRKAARAQDNLTVYPLTARYQARMFIDSMIYKRGSVSDQSLYIGSCVLSCPTPQTKPKPPQDVQIRKFFLLIFLFVINAYIPAYLVCFRYYSVDF